jgi:class 3 adenylate cyclase
MLDAIALTAAGFIAWKAGNKYARLFVAAWICYLLGALLLIGRNMGILPGNMVTNNFANIGSAMEVVLLSLALADKVRILRIEKEESDMKVLKMQKELTASLENKVALRTSQLQQEKDKSDKLLLNILPMSIAEELKENGKAGAKKHENVTVLFTDFVNFTKICEELEPEVLVRELDECFRLFDEITHKYNLEKIKTIGDAYLCACGVPSPIPDHAEKTILAAKEILEAINVFNAQNIQKSLPEFKIRIGVHTGPLISGVVGTRKFAYDIWGDTVNIAARMEQNSETGKINISQVTYELVRDKFDFVHRGKVKVKNKNEIDMYFLNTEN